MILRRILLLRDDLATVLLQAALLSLLLHLRLLVIPLLDVVKAAIEALALP